ncbi:MAG TPA: hypothetical protein VFY48_01430 [Solirubrobacterales bacterium]|nr:hypothetical protein [Solirubrobacterales bacterium]
MAVPAAAPAAAPLQGVLDRSFGDGGRAFAALGDTFAPTAYTAMVRQPDGGIVAGGTTVAVKGIYNERSGFVQRRHPDGSLDTGFGGGLILVPGVGGLALQEDGRVLVGVRDRDDPCSSISTVWRLDASGARDGSFGDSGVSPQLPISVSHLAVDGEGRIVVAGVTNTSPCGKSAVPSPALAVARLLPSGALDPSFGENGIARTPVVKTYFSTIGSLSNGLVVREDGSILAAGVDALHAFTPTGAPDTSFGNAGMVEVAGTPGALLGLPGGKAVLASTSAESCCKAAGQFVVSRYLANGSLDPAFGGGTVSLAVGKVDSPTALAAGPGESVLLGGEAASSDECDGECDFAPFLARFATDGQLDPGFGQGGQLSPDLPARTRVDYTRYVAALTVAPSGQVLVAGGSGDAAEATVSALGPNGAPDTAFGAGGRASDPQPLPSVTSTRGVAVAPSGAILASAWSDAGAHRPQPILAAWGRDGAPDRGAGGGAGFVVPGTDEGLEADGRNRFYSVATASSLRGDGYVGRFDALGRPDPGYGSGGRAAIPSRFDVQALVVRRDGTALLVGRVARRFGMAAFKLTPAGRPDRRFGRGGLAFVKWGREVKANALAAAFDRRGRVVLFGNYDNFATGMARLLPSGRLDQGFARRGRLLRMPALAGERSAVAIGPRGAILLAASSGPDLGPPPTTLIGFRPDGARDPSFGRNGVVRVDSRGSMVGFFGGGRPILVSGAGGFGERGVTIRAFKANGRLDRSFGRRGVVTAETSSANRFRPAAAARLPDGRIVVAGSTGKIEQAGATIKLLRFR